MLINIALHIAEKIPTTCYEVNRPANMLVLWSNNLPSIVMAGKWESVIHHGKHDLVSRLPSVDTDRPTSQQMIPNHRRG